jgi:hypothetical protein
VMVADDVSCCCAFLFSAFFIHFFLVASTRKISRKTKSPFSSWMTASTLLLTLCLCVSHCVCVCVFLANAATVLQHISTLLTNYREENDNKTSISTAYISSACMMPSYAHETHVSM